MGLGSDDKTDDVDNGSVAQRISADDLQPPTETQVQTNFRIKPTVMWTFALTLSLTKELSTARSQCSFEVCQQKSSMCR